MNNKFWKFEKDELALYMTDRVDYEISDFWTMKKSKLRKHLSMVV